MGATKYNEAILFTNSGITDIVELFSELFEAGLSKVRILKLIKIQKPPLFSEIKFLNDFSTDYSSPYLLV